MKNEHVTKMIAVVASLSTMIGSITPGVYAGEIYETEALESEMFSEKTEYSILNEDREILIPETSEEIQWNTDLDFSKSDDMEKAAEENDYGFILNQEKMETEELVIDLADAASGPKEMEKDISECSILLSEYDYMYDGEEKTPEVHVFDGTILLKEGTDYSLVYRDNLKAGVGIVEITGCGDYTGTAEERFSILTEISYISKVENVQGGVKITWNSVAGAAYYRIFRRPADDTSAIWPDMDCSNSTTYVDRFVESGKSYSYKVRCISEKGVPVSAHEREGKTITYIAAPVLSSVVSSGNGIAIKWKASPGAEKYRVFRKTPGGSWKKIGETTTTTEFLDTTADFGITYIYSVRCISKDGSHYTSGYDAKGLTGVRIASPEIASVSNVLGGVSVKWKNVTGAEKYRVFRKVAGEGWKKVGDTTGTSFTDQTAQGGTKYFYTLRCVSADGKTYTSSYNASGKSILYIEAPKITTINQLTNGLKISWTNRAGAVKYGIFRKDTSGKWKRLAITKENSYTDLNAANCKMNSYAVRCLSNDEKNYTSAYYSEGMTMAYIAAPEVEFIRTGKSEATIKWNRNSSASGYEVAYKIGSMTKTEKLENKNTTSFTLKNLTIGSNCLARVRAYKISGGKIYYSAWCDLKKITLAAVDDLFFSGEYDYD